MRLKMFYYPRATTRTLLVLSAFHLNPVHCRGGRGGGGGVHGIDDSGSSLGLSPNMTAVFALTVVVSIVTLYQLVLSIGRFKKRQLPQDEPPSSDHDVGPVFLKLLFFYLLVFLISNIVYAVSVAFDGDDSIAAILPGGLNVGAAFTGQLAYALLFATLLCITRHRQRIQLSPYAKTFDLKFFFEAFMLFDILAIGIAQDAVGSHASSPIIPGLGEPIKIWEALDAEIITVVFQVLVFVASVYATGYAMTVHGRLRRANIPDRIIWTVAFLAGPALLVITLYRLITVSIAYADVAGLEFIPFTGPYFVRSATGIFNMEGLLIADTVIAGLVFIFVASCCLRMGAPLRAEKKKV